jgi:hypothetical protein
MSEKDDQKIRYRLKILSQVEPSSESLERAKAHVRGMLTEEEKPRSTVIKIYRLVCNIQTVKTAAAAVLLIGVGFIAGRLFAPAVDIEELQAALEPAIRQELQEQWRQTYSTGFTQIKNELAEQFSRDLAEFAEQTLAASSNMTDQRLNELVQLIEAARAKDRQWIAAALEKIEFNRRQDNTRLGNGLVTLATRTNDLRRIEEN